MADKISLFSIFLIFVFIIPAISAQLLSWAPPKLISPLNISVPTTGGNFKLNQSRDYIIRMPASPVLDAVSIWGGRNVHLIGGEIVLYRNRSQALNLNDFVGTMHVEGLRIDPGGSRGFEQDAIRVNSRYNTSVGVFQNIWVDLVSDELTNK